MLYFNSIRYFLNILAITEDSKLLFSELSGRLMPFYGSYDKIHYLIDQCDKMAAKLNPIVPVGQIYHSPSWINEECLDFGIKASNGLQLDLVESDFNGKLLILKSSNSLQAKIFDLDIFEQRNDIQIGKGLLSFNIFSN